MADIAAEIRGDGLGAAPAYETQSEPVRVMELTPRPDSLREWVRDIWRHSDVLMVLARKDFQTRYKRASLGVIWAVAVPLLQASIMAVVFSRVIKLGSGPGYGVHVMAGVIAFSYFSMVLTLAATSIVDGSNLSEKVWFPRALLVLVPILSNSVGLLVSLVALMVAVPILGAHFGLHILLLIPAVLLLMAFTASLALCLAALHVYFRDVRFMVQAALLVWIYVTPILYPVKLLGRLGPVVYANPMTGVVILFQAATGTAQGARLLPVGISIGVTLLLFAIGAEVQRRHDRLFVDLL